MRYYIIAGEASGDLHGSNLAKHLFSIDCDAQIRAWGGQLLKNVGAEVVKDYKDLAFMGFIDVAKHFKTIFDNIQFCKNDILSFQPDVVILIDYPGFNLRIAKFLHAQKIPVFYYILPQLWAWHKSRIKIMKKCVNQLFAILPFEKQFYATEQMDVHYFGHPLLDVIKQYAVNEHFMDKNKLDKRPIIAILPGSRKQEIVRMLPIMLSASLQFPDYQFVIAGVENHKSLYSEICKNTTIPIIYNQTYDLLAVSHAAMVTSGTATLETALFKIPQVVCYRSDYVSYSIAKKLIHDIEYISLVNLITKQPVVTELIQNQLTTDNLVKELQLILGNTQQRARMLKNYELLETLLGNGTANQSIAKKMIEIMKKE
ncbi:MAG: lipid-A-disaccharide synthase [Bacteroidales bacterium]|jgi:lipid-A-disaccharide synthase|nr:lipid-A-disaccharide synthase [Bacteroidales bacterium]